MLRILRLKKKKKGYHSEKKEFIFPQMLPADILEVLVCQHNLQKPECNLFRKSHSKSVSKEQVISDNILNS